MTIIPWPNRKASPIKSIDKFWYRQTGRLVTEICLGERYAHISPGMLFNDEIYRGSYIDNWHGGPSGSLTDMIKWLSEAEHPEYGYNLWMIP